MLRPNQSGEHMAEIILVRHGQANSTAKTEADYDRLSDLGHQQARWLGERISQTNGHFERVISGTLRRQRETAEGIGHSAPHTEISTACLFPTDRPSISPMPPV